MTARRVVVTIFLSFVTLACLWIPWQAPSMLNASMDERFLEPRPDPSGATVHLGYGWIWTGPKLLQGSDTPSAEALADYGKLGRMKATQEAHGKFREPTEQELESAASIERTLWSARISMPRMFYRNHARPDFMRIALVLTAASAFAGVLYCLILKAKGDGNPKNT